MNTPPLNDFFLGPELKRLGEICREGVFQRALAYYQLSRPPIVHNGTATAESVGLAGAQAHGWEQGGEFWKQFTSPAEEKPRENEFADVTSDLPGHTQ